MLGSELSQSFPDDAELIPLPFGAAMRSASSAAVLVDERSRHQLGAVLAWADQRGVVEVDLLVDDGAAALARRAGHFDRPVRVWQIDGTAVRPARPAAIPEIATPSEAALDLVGTLRDVGLDIVIEHGEVLGEVLGLEVARVVVEDEYARIDVGVGRHDREAFATVHGHVPTHDALAGVVEYVRRHRRGGDLTHPLARLAGERWLRHQLIRSPSMVGARNLEPAEPALPRKNIKEPAAAIAVGTSPDGEELVVACSVGVDLDLVPSGADARAVHASDARLLLAVPQRDALPITNRLADSLTRPAAVVPVPNAFRG